jgi:arginine repressor
MKPKKDQIRCELIIECLKENQFATKDELIDYVETNANIDNHAERTLSRDLNSINKDGTYTIKAVTNNNVSCYTIIDKPLKKMEEEQILSLPILFNLMNMQKELESVLWLKYILNTNYGIDESDWEKETYFSSPSIEWSNEAKVLELSINLIKHIKKGNILAYDYKPVTPSKPIQSLTIAPLQIRFYDGRYYLIGAEFIEGVFNLKDLKVMAIDQIRDWKVKQTITFDGKQTFDYQDFAKKSKLKDYFKYSIGVVVPENKNSYKKITIRFTGWAKSYIKNKKIHFSQKIITTSSNDDSVVVQIEVYDNFELEFVLGRFRGYADRLDKKKK